MTGLQRCDLQSNAADNANRTHDKLEREVADGMQADYVRVPFASTGLVKLPDEVGDEQAIMLSDIFPTAWFGARMAEVGDSDVVTVFGCGPVGRFAILSAMLQGAGRILAVDHVPSRLEAAKRQGAEVIDFDAEDPGAGHRRADRRHRPRPRDLRGGRRRRAAGDGGPRRRAGAGAGVGDPGGRQGRDDRHHRRVPAAVAGVPHRPGNEQEPDPQDGQLQPPPLPAEAGDDGALRCDPGNVLTQVKDATSAIDAYRSFDRHEAGWIKVELLPGS